MKNIGTAEQAIAFALDIDDHFDMREFLKSWSNGSLARDEGEWDDYFDAIKATIAEPNSLPVNDERKEA